MNKKGLSAVLTNVILISLCLIVAGVVGIIIKNSFQEGVDEITIDQITLDLEISRVQVLNDTDIAVTLKRNVGGGDLSGVAFVMYDKNSSEVVQLNISMEELETRNYSVILHVVNASLLNKISIAPIFKRTFSKDKLGTIIDDAPIVVGRVTSGGGGGGSSSGSSNSDPDDIGDAGGEGVVEIVETCSDAIQNQDELGADCGGVCGNVCLVETSCSTGEYLFNDVCLLTVPGNTYFVATWGNDSNNGSFDFPWGTWEKGFQTTEAGGIVYFRGGTYSQNLEVDYNPSINRGYVGTESNPIRFYNYPGERPVLDFSGHTNTRGTIVGLSILDSDYLYLKGLTVRSLHQIVDEQWIAGVSISNVTNLYLEEMVSYDHGGSGFFIKEYDFLNITNCDSYDNIDYTSVGIPGGRADGYNIGSGGLSTDIHKKMHITGSRAWNNSDDGFDLATTKQFQITDTWSFSNGRIFGDAVGFKMSYSNIRDPIQRRIYNSLSINNTGFDGDGSTIGSGFASINLYSLTDGPVGEYSNNLVYKSTTGFFSSPQTWDPDTYPTGDDVMQNNIVYDSSIGAEYLKQAWLYAEWYDYPNYVTANNNTWRLDVSASPWVELNPAVTVTDEDFASLNISQLSASRKPDGSLPDVTFGYLAEGSDLIDKGMIVPGLHCPTEGEVGDCVTWYGDAPDLGPFESNYEEEIIETPISNTGYIIADHNSADDFDIIPTCWIERAKDDFKIAYQHTSHGSQITNGIDYFMDHVDSSLYANGGSLVADTLFFRDYEMDVLSNVSAPDVGYIGWDQETRAYLDVNQYSINTVMWSWCGQAGGYSTNESMFNHYLGPANQIANYYGVNFIYMTGHLESEGDFIANTHIRNHVKAVNGTLFDFADIESYNPNGVDFSTNNSDACQWCNDWCSNNEDCTGILAGVDNCAHSHDYNCYRKGKAFWWMLARMAGWDGQPGDDVTDCL